jgi:hypothetical protein
MKGLLKKIYFLFAFAFTTQNLTAQTGIYKTYEDYKSGNIELIENVTNVWWKGGFGRTVVFEIKDKKSKKYKLKEFWGFTYKNHLFRSMLAGYTELVCVLDSGKMILYTHGGAQLTLLKEGSNFGFIENGSAECFLSLDYSSEIFHTHWNSYSSKIYPKKFRKRYEQFVENYPQFQTMYDCIGDTYSFFLAKGCIMKFNRTE